MHNISPNVATRSRKVYIDVSFKTSINASEVLGSFLLWFDHHEESGTMRHQPMEDWPSVTHSFVTTVVRQVLFTEGMRRVKDADNLVREVTLLRKQEIKIWLSAVVQF